MRRGRGLGTLAVAAIGAWSCDLAAPSSEKTAVTREAAVGQWTTLATGLGVPRALFSSELRSIALDDGTVLVPGAARGSLRPRQA